MPGKIKIDGRVLTPRSPATYAASQSSGTAVAANVDRLAVVITNVGSSKVYLAFGVAAQANYGVGLAAGAQFTMSERYTGTITAICATGETSTLAVQEFN